MDRILSCSSCLSMLECIFGLIAQIPKAKSITHYTRLKVDFFFRLFHDFKFNPELIPSSLNVDKYRYY